MFGTNFRLCWIINRCGFGLEDFASTAKTEYSVVVLNSYLQSINLKQVHQLHHPYMLCILFQCRIFVEVSANFQSFKLIIADKAVE